MATIDKDLLLDKIDRLLKLHNYAREDWFANVIHNTVWDSPEIETDGDLIRRADAIEAAGEWMQKEFGYLDLNRAERLIDALSALPSADAVSREDYHNLLTASNDIDRALREYQAKEEQPSADADRPKVVGVDYSPYRVQTTAPSAEAVHGEWIPCSEGLPKELEAVNVTWVNHNPPCYYIDIMDVPFTATGVYHDGKWYWWDATVIDLLGEYDGAYVHGIEPTDKYIEITAWMPLPNPYKGEETA